MTDRDYTVWAEGFWDTVAMGVGITLGIPFLLVGLIVVFPFYLIGLLARRCGWTWRDDYER